MLQSPQHRATWWHCPAAAGAPSHTPAQSCTATKRRSVTIPCRNKLDFKEKDCLSSIVTKLKIAEEWTGRKISDPSGLVNKQEYSQCFCIMQGDTIGNFNGICSINPWHFFLMIINFDSLQDGTTDRARQEKAQQLESLIGKVRIKQQN